MEVRQANAGITHPVGVVKANTESRPGLAWWDLCVQTELRY